MLAPITKPILKNVLFDVALVILSYFIARPFEGPLALWSPITVLIILQPTKGMTYHLGLQRLFGTIVGSLLALVLIHVLTPTHAIIVLALTTIVALAAALSSLGKIINGYAFQSAGFTTAIVYLLSLAHQDRMLSYPLLRVGGIFVGILVTMVGLNIIKRESERVKLNEATQEVKDLVRQWVRMVLRHGPSDESTTLRVKIVNATNSLNNLSEYAASERFFFGSSRRNTLHIMGTVYTIISLTRAHVRKLEGKAGRENFTEQDFSDVWQQFQALDVYPPQLNRSSETNWQGVRRAFIRLMFAGLSSGGLWLLTGLPVFISFFMNTLVHTCVFTTNHRAKDKVKNILIGLTGALLSVTLFHSIIGVRPMLEVHQLFFLLLPALVFALITGRAGLGTVIMLFTLVLYSISTGYGERLTIFAIFTEYLSFGAGVSYSLLLNQKLLPVQADKRYRFYRYRLFLEMKRVTDVKRPLEPDWMPKMYSYIEGMLSYASDIKMDEIQIMNEGLLAVDVCVEVLEIRSQIPTQDMGLKDKLMESLPMISEAKMPVDDRCQRLKTLAEDFIVINPIISHNLKVISQKIKQNEKFFEMRVS